MRDEYDGQVPDNFDALIALPGIGRSTAGAILALAYRKHYAILDGNVKRVLARHALIETWTGDNKVLKALWSLAENLTPSERVDDYTQAIMDLGASVCARRKPQCLLCPVSDDCSARLAGRENEIEEGAAVT